MKSNTARKSLRAVVAACFLIFLSGCGWMGYLTGNKFIPISQNKAVAHVPVYHMGDWTIARGVHP